MTATMKLEIVTMTPEWAHQILIKQNTKNRHMRPSVVRRYARAIESGQWKLTQQGVAIGSNGVLLDGQHRLAAIVEAGQPVKIALATDCDPSIFMVMDTGCARMAADVLQMGGVGNPTTAAAGLKLYILYNRHPDKIWTGQQLRLPSHTDIEACNRQRFKDVAWACPVVLSAYRRCKRINKSACFAFTLLALDAGWPESTVENFCEKLGSGAGLADTSPILRFRTFLINEVIRKGGGNTQIHLACLIKTFNYWNEGAAVKLFRPPTIPAMPTIAALP
jgi:hypothetical protein